MPILNRGLLNSTALTNVSLISAGLMLVSAPAMAQAPNTLPTGGTVIGGQATISQSGNTLNVIQSTNNAAINWQSFSIGTAATTNFFQPGASSIAVNRVTGIDPSLIEGHLNANGQVVLVNPNGILFSKSAQVNVGGLVASTSGISEKNAIAGNLIFDQGSNPNAKIVNNGHITAKDGGLVALVAPSVINNGVITAKLGRVSLAAGDKWTLDLYGDRLVNFAVNDKVAGEVKNTGVVSADGGSVQITADVAKDVVNNAINMSGVVEVSSVSQQGGTIVLEAANGTVDVTGKLAATGTTGGTIDVTGENVVLKGATIDASGTNGGGTINIGGQSHGGGTLAHAKSVTIDSSSKLVADAIASGNGGDITVWSDGTTDFAGSASAKGIAQGGTIETSGHVLSIDGAKVNVSATSGANGTWLLDPFDLTIDQGGAQAIETGLAYGNVLVETTASGADGNVDGVTTGTTSTGSIAGFGTVTNGTGDINVDSSITWSSANSLTLSAYDGINVNASIVDNGTGNITLRADNTGSGTVAGQVTFNGATANTGGAVSIYYDNTNYANPITYSGVATGTSGVIGYMLVNSVADMNRINTNLAGDYALGTNITVGGQFSSIGSVTNPFTGLFDGNGGLGVNYTIDNVILGQTGQSHVGVFADNSGTIRNLTVSGAVAYGYDNVGIIVGENSGALTNDGAKNFNIYTDAGSTYVGGLLGKNDISGILNNDTITGNVTVGDGSSYAGGVVGINYGFATNSSFTGTVDTGCNEIGGFAGTNYGTITNSFASGYVINRGGGQTGGFIGTNYGLLSNDSAHNTNVSVSSGNYDVGGFAGSNYTGGTIVNSSMTGSVNAAAGSNIFIGGFVGENAGLIDSDSATNPIVNSAGGRAIAGFAGQNDINGTISNSTVSGGSISGTNTYGLIAGFAGGNYGLLTNDIASNINVSIPSDNIRIGGFAGLNWGGTILNSSVLGTLLAGTSTSLMGGFVGQNLDLTNTVTGAVISNGIISDSVATTTMFVGDGSGTIGGFAGLNTGTISNSMAHDTELTIGTGSNNVGGFAGYNGGQLIDDTVSGRLGASSTYIANLTNVGGFVGNNVGFVSGGTATGYFYAGNQSENAGGMVGINSGTVLASSFDGTIQAGASDVGGFVGNNLGMIESSSATGNVINGGGGNIGGFAGENSALLSGDTASSMQVSLSVYVGNAGGFVGLNDASGTVINSKATDNLTDEGAGALGGFAGKNAGLLSNDTVTDAQLSVAGNYEVGGFVGLNIGTVSNSSATGTVLAGAQSSRIGGFVGANSGIVENSSADILLSVGSASSQIGGFAGYNNGNLINDTSTGAVTVGDSSIDVGGYIGANQGATISGVTMTSSVHAGNYDVNVGGLVGYNLNGSLVNDTVTADVITGSGSRSVGGEVGLNSGVVSGAFVEGLVSIGGGSQYAGGVIGANYGNVSDSVFSGSMDAGCNYVGGFVGGNFATITDSYATGTVSNGGGGELGGFAGENAGFLNADSAQNTSINVAAANVDVGGLVGINLAGGIVDNSTVYGLVTAGSSSSNIGGFAGLNVGTINDGSARTQIVTNTGSTNIGGYVGQNQGIISGGAVLGSVMAGSDTSAIGGFAGNNSGLISGAIALPNVFVGNNSTDIGGFVGINSGALINNQIFSSYTISEYPIVIPGQPTPEFILNVGLNAAGILAGTSESNVGGYVGLQNGGVISGGTVGGSLKLGAYSTDVGGVIGNNQGGVVTGVTYNGNGTASGLVLVTSAVTNIGTINVGGNSSNIGGFSGYNNATGILNNDIVTNQDILTGDHSTDVGGIVGYNAGKISGGSAYGTISVGFGSSYVGGYAGENNGPITNAQAGETIIAAFDGTGTSGVIGVQGVGGFVGKNDLGAIVSNSQANGTIDTKDGVAVGGFGGWNLGGGTIINSSSVENITAVDDVNTSAGFPNLISASSAGFRTNAGGGAIGGFLGFNEGVLTTDAALNSNVTAENGAVAIGGFAGANFGSITNGFQSGTVTAGVKALYVGGFLGINSDLTYPGNVVTGTANSQVYVGANSDLVGGFVGYNLAGTISGGTSTGTISAGAGATNLGGFAGGNAGIINDDRSSEYIITGTGLGSAINVGGLVGSNTRGGVVSNGSFTGNIILDTGTNVGGLVGYNDASSTISNGTVNAYVLVNNGGSAIGGYVGANFSGALIGGGVSGGVAAGVNSVDVGGFAGYNQNSTISAVTVSDSVFADNNSINIGGLVGFNDHGSLINDTIHANVATNGVTRSVGGEVGLNSGVVSGAHVDGLVSIGGGSQYAGGVIGANYGYVSASSFSGTMAAGCNYVGGFVGGNFSTIVDSSSTGYVTNGGGGELGGFAGENAGLLSTDSAVNSNVIVASGNVNIGGFVGQNDTSGIVINSTATGGSVLAQTGITNEGGFAGYNAGTLTGDSANVSSTAIGSLSSKVYNAMNVGGFVGNNDVGGIITNASAGGTISAGFYSGDIGGLAGINMGTITNGFENTYLTVATYGVDVGGLVGFNQGLIQGGEAFGYMYVDSNASYESRGVGGIVGYNGSNGAQNGVVNNASANTNIIMGTNADGVGEIVGINFSTVNGGTANGLISAATGVFIGGFVGDNSFGTISGGYSNATINVSGAGTAIGGFAGYNAGTKLTGSAAGAVTVGDNSSNIGGFVGDLEFGSYGAALSGVSSSTSVHVGNNSNNVGGLVGYNSTGTIVDSISTGAVTVANGATAVGGLVGYNNNGLVSASTSTSSVSTGENAFYVGGGVGWNDAGGTVTNMTVQDVVAAGSDSTAIGGIVGLNGSDPTNNRGNFGTASASVANSSFSGTVTVGDGSFAVGGLAGWNSDWTKNGVSGAGSLSNVMGSGLVTSPVNGGTTYIHNANQVGCDEVGGNCFGVAGQEVITVSPNSLTIAYGQTANLTYDTTYSAPGGTPNGLESGDPSSILQVNLQNSQTNVGSSAITGSANIDPNNANALLDYKVVFSNSPPATVTVTQKAITITANGSQTYGGTNINVSYTFTGLVNGDTSSIVSGYSYSTPATASSNAGTYTISAVGGTAQNYTIVDATGGTFIVNKATVTATAGGSQTYGGTNVNVSYAYQGLVNGDTGAAISGLGYLTPVTASSNAGTYSIAATGGTAQNYNVVDATGVYTVNKANLLVTENGSQTYGGTNATVTPVYTGLVNGDSSGVVSGVTFTNPVTASSNAGLYTIAVTGGTAQNYNVTDVNGTYTVNKASLTASAGGSQTYGGTNLNVSYSYAGFVNGDTSAAVSGISYTTPATASSNAGTYTIAAAGGTAQNYTIVDATGGTFIVNKANLSVTENGSQTYGGANATVTPVYTGLVNGDNAGVVSGVTFTNPVTASSNAGTYTIAVTGGTAQNYNVTDVNGTYTVGKAALTVSASGSQTYGGANATLGQTYVGLVNGDTGAVVSGVSVSNPVTASSNAGTYTLGVTGGTAQNYTVTDVNGTYTVNKAGLTVAASGSQTYGGSSVAISYTYNGLVNGDSSGVVTGISYTTPATASSNAGTYSISPTGGMAQNYTITDATGTFTVNKANLSVTENGSQTYGGSNATTTPVYTGLVNGDNSGVVTGITFTNPANASSNAGTYTIAVTGGMAANYNVTDTNGTYVVNKAPLTVGATGSETYGGTSPMITYTYTGLVNGDTGSSAVTGLSYTTTATSTSNVGTYTIASTGGSSSNYTVSNGPAASFSVTPASLTITANDTTRTQGSNTPAFSATFAGLVNGDASSVVTGLTYSPGDTSTLAQGVYTDLITITGGMAQNYVLTYDPGTLTVTAPGGVINPPGTGGNPTIPGQVINVTGQISGLNSLLQTFNATANNTNNQVNCLKVNSEVRGVTTDSPIDCAAPLQVNGF